MTSNFAKLLETRRSNYFIGNTPELSKKDISALVSHAVKYTPTAFNSQTARTVILFGNDHQKFWNLTLSELQKVTPPDRFAATQNKIASFAAGFGTILFFEEQETITALQKQFPLYKDNFPIWSEQGSAILQFAVWCIFAEHQIGASLQHYSPLVDTFTAREWKIPNSWKLIAQMPFGNITRSPETKDFLPLKDRIKIYG